MCNSCRPMFRCRPAAILLDSECWILSLLSPLLSSSSSNLTGYALPYHLRIRPIPHLKQHSLIPLPLAPQFFILLPSLRQRTSLFSVLEHGLSLQRSCIPFVPPARVCSLAPSASYVWRPVLCRSIRNHTTKFGRGLHFLSPVFALGSRNEKGCPFSRQASSLLPRCASRDN